MAPDRHSMTELHRATVDSTGANVTDGYLAAADGAGNVEWIDPSTITTPNDAYSLGTLGATETVDYANGTWQYGTLDQDCDIDFTGFTAGKDEGITLEIAEDGTGGWTPNLIGVTWIGAAPTWDTTAGTTTLVGIMSRDGGTTILAGIIGGSSVQYLDDLLDVSVPTPADGDVLTWSDYLNLWIAQAPSGAAIEVLDEGVSLTMNLASIDFVGAGVTATTVGDDVTVTVPGTTTAEIQAAALPHVHVAYETHTSDGSTTTFTLDQVYEPGSVMAWNRTAGTLLGVTEVAPDQATVSAAGTAADLLDFHYAASTT